ncbi:MAG: alpha/beta hydrolase family protein [Congregibacter sp.]
MKPTSEFFALLARASAALVVLMSALNAALRDTGYGNLIEFIGGMILGMVAIAICLFLLMQATRVLKGVPLSSLLLIAASLVALGLLFDHSPTTVLSAILDRGKWAVPALPDAFSAASLSALTLALAGLIAIACMILRARLSVPARPFAVVGVVLAVLATAIVLRLSNDGGDPFADDGLALLQVESALDISDPSQSGEFSVVTFTYGAGENKKRPEYAAGRELTSRTVDARRLLPEWKDFKATMRERYWGFGLDEAPLNGRVWMPAAPGTFPLVLIVHGNHGMEDYSDDGYAYLGELLASRGFIAVSVDQNYINGSWSGDFRGKEMAARGWLLLEHLALWRDWNKTEGHRLFSQVDMQNIALIGHSRGGEAVSIAQRFNSLPFFPDDATVVFDYGFNIRSLVAIAQVDQRYFRRVELEDVNFFTIHGSYDSDEPAYHGLRQINRISFGNSPVGNNNDYFLKAGVYLHGANHGQFNTGWGRYDISPPGSWRLNTAPIVSGQEQRQAAKVFITAFLEATLREQLNYVALLRDPRLGAGWLPKRSFVNQFEDTTFVAIANFEEDLNVTTGSRVGASIAAENLLRWREIPLVHRDQRLQGSNAVQLSWRSPNAALDIRSGSIPSLSEQHSLVFSVSASLDALPPSMNGPEQSTQTGTSTPSIPDFSVELTDQSGQRASLAVSEYAQLIPPVRVLYLKNATRNEKDYKADWEPVLQHIELPLDAFKRVNQDFDIAGLAAIRFVFDRTAQGNLLLDDVGVSLSPPVASN